MYVLLNPCRRLLGGLVDHSDNPSVGVGVSKFALVRLGGLTVELALDRVLTVDSCTLVVGSILTLGHRVAVNSGMLTR